MGDIMDNMGECNHHISNMKENIGKERIVKEGYEKIINNYLEEVNFMRKSFVWWREECNAFSSHFI